MSELHEVRRAIFAKRVAQLCRNLADLVYDVPPSRITGRDDEGTLEHADDGARVGGSHDDGCEDVV